MTPQEREVMQMALEALTIFREWELGQDYNSNRDTVLQRAFKAEEALRAALAQPEQEPVALSVRFPRHAPKHGEDWIIDPSFLLRIYHSIDPDAHYGFIPTMEEIETALLALEVIPSKLYTTPPQQPEPPCKTGSQCVGGKCERCAVQEPCDGNFPEGFNELYGIPAQALRAANAIMFDVIGERNWDVPCTAKHLLAFASNYTALPQSKTKQEPVAWRHWLQVDGEQFPQLTLVPRTDKDDPLYTAPPQREWQGLTDEEQGEVAWSCGAMSADWLDFARAVEAKLREKNL